MKKVFFLLFSMNLGGVEKSFLNLISQVDRCKYEVHLGLLKRKGGLLGEVPSWVFIHQIDCYTQYWELLNNPPQNSLNRFLSERKYGQYIIFLVIFILCKLSASQTLLYRYVLRNHPAFDDKFDVAVAYAGPAKQIDYYLAEKVNAKVKCGWIHFDITKVGIDKKMISKEYKKYRKIFCVSDRVKQLFDNAFPDLAFKTEVICNLINPVNIKQSAEIVNVYNDNFKGIRLLTIGRISREKGQLLALDALSILQQKGLNVRWYFVGEGKLLEECKAKSIALGLDEYTSFCGASLNPYPYIKGCDIYVQPSLHEGDCITLAEARIFSQPIVATDFTGAREQLSHRTNAFITNFTAEDLAEGILKACKAPRITYEDTIQQSDINQLLSLC